MTDDGEEHGRINRKEKRSYVSKQLHSLTLQKLVEETQGDCKTTKEEHDVC